MFRAGMRLAGVFIMLLATACGQPSDERIGKLEDELASAEKERRQLREELAETNQRLASALATSERPRARRPSVQRPVPSDDPDEPEEQELPDGVERIAAGQFRVASGALARLDADKALAARALRLRPSRLEPKGLRIYGVRSKSTMAALGFRSGDVLTKFGSCPTADVEALSSCFGKLANPKTRGANKVIEIEVIRRGESIPFRFEIVD